MRMLYPGVRVRRRVRQLLQVFYTKHEAVDFDEALNLLAAFYQVRKPEVCWWEHINGTGKRSTLGETRENGRAGRLNLIHPADWPRQAPTAKFKATRTSWVRTLLHEWNHVMHHIDDEKKADRYAAIFLRGL